MATFDPQQLAREASAAFDSGDHVRALALLDQLQTLDGDNPAVLALRASTLLHLGDWREAAAEAEAAARLAPEDARVQFVLAQASWRNGNIGAAQRAFESAVRLSDREPQLLAEYALFMAHQRGPRLAEDAARAAIEAEPRLTDAWVALGLAQLKMHRRDAAYRSLSEALRLDSNSSAAQSVMVLVLRERGETDRAAALVNVMQDQPENSAFVAAMRKELNIRRANRMLMERPAVQKRLFAPPAPSLRTRAGRATSVFVFLAILGVGSWISYDRNEPWLLATAAGSAAIGAWVSGLFFR